MGTTFGSSLRFNSRVAQLIADRVRVSDLRGDAGVPAPAAVLEDPTGRRRRRLRFAGRVLALALTLWLVALVLGSVGLSPVPGVPFARVLRPAGPPPPTKKLPKPEQPRAADLEPALPATHSTTAVAPQPVPVAGQVRTRRTTRVQTPIAKRHGGGSPRSVAVHTMSPAVDGGALAAHGPKIAHANNGKSSATTTTTTTTTPGRSGAAPGQAGTAPGRSKTTSTGSP